MKNRKLYAAALAATLAVSAFGTTVMAAEGTTNFKYQPGKAAPALPQRTLPQRQAAAQNCRPGPGQTGLPGR